jgi:hypothetical protein
LDSQEVYDKCGRVCPCVKIQAFSLPLEGVRGLFPRHGRAFLGLSAGEIMKISVGDVVSLKKQHPCGANEWKVFRVGVDIGLECTGCGRKVVMARSEFERRYRSHVE